MPIVVDAAMAPPQLRECCGLLQELPAIMPGVVARCTRCPTSLLRMTAHPESLLFRFCHSQRNLDVAASPH
jgi:hypothetical protein